MKAVVSPAALVLATAMLLGGFVLPLFVFLVTALIAGAVEAKSKTAANEEDVAAH